MELATNGFEQLSQALTQGTSETLTAYLNGLRFRSPAAASNMGFCAEVVFQESSGIHRAHFDSDEGKHMEITVETTVKAPGDAVWHAWTTPDDIMQWNAASADWHTIAANIDLRVGGRFFYRMEAKDGSMGFDFTGVFTKVMEQKLIEFELEDGRAVSVEFTTGDAGVTVRETFEAESADDGEQQRQGWQAILNKFAKHVEEKT